MRLRPLSLVAGLAVASTALVAVPSPAQAAALTAGEVYAGRSVSENGPATCNTSNTSSSSNSAFTSDGVTVTQIASGTTHLDDTLDASDTVDFTTSTTSRVRATESAGQLRTVDIDATLTGSFVAAQGLATDCDASAQLSTQFTFQTVLSASRWVTLDAVLPPGATAQLIIQRTMPTTPVVQEIVILTGTQKGRAQAQVLLPAGAYVAQGIVATTYASPQTAGDPTSFSYKPHIHVDYLDAGVAKDTAEGDGTAYARFKDVRDCATNQLKGKFLKAAGTKAEPTLKKAIFKVNGVKSKVVKKAKKGGRITLKNLPAGEDVLVTATFKLKGGGKKSFSREYYSCT